ncbi:MAG: tetratricopeptide repeat protein [Ignavibacteriales bacterium]
MNPTDAYAHFNKAVTYEKVGRFQEAVEAYKSFIRYAPSQSPDIERAKQRIIVLEDRPSPIRHRKAND